MVITRKPDCLTVATVTTDGTYVVYADARSTSVSCYQIQCPDAPALKLFAVHGARSITALQLGRAAVGSLSQSPEDAYTLLAAATNSQVLIWGLEDAYGAAASGRPAAPPAVVIPHEGAVSAISFSPQGNLLALCVGHNVMVVDLMSMEEVYRLEGHQGAVTCAAFCTHASHLLVTASEDRTFKVWDLEDGVLLHQSAIISSSPFTTMAMDPSFPRMALGAADGSVRFVDLSALPACRHLQVADLGRSLNRLVDQYRIQRSEDEGGGGPRIIRAQPAWRGFLGSSPQDPPSITDDWAHLSGSALAMTYSAFYVPETRGKTGLFGEGPQLLVCTPYALVVMDTHTYEVVSVFLFDQESPEQQARQQEDGRDGNMVKSLSQMHPAGCCAIAPHLASGTMYCCTAGAFSSVLQVMSLHKAWPVDLQTPTHHVAGLTLEHPASGDPLSTPTCLSVFSMQPLPPESPLRVTPLAESSTDTSKQKSPAKAVGQGKTASKGAKPCQSAVKRPGTNAGGLLNRKAPSKKLEDLPVTFHRKVKSSGYGLVHGPTRLGSSRPSPVKVAHNQTPGTKVFMMTKAMRQYPLSCGPLTCGQEQHTLPGRAPVHGGAIVSMTYAPDGGRLLTCGGDKMARSLRLPLSRHQGDGCSFLGHNGPLTSAVWSLDGSYVLTASADRSPVELRSEQPPPPIYACASSA